MTDQYRRAYQSAKQRKSDDQGRQGMLIGRVNYPDPNTGHVNVTHARGPSNKQVSHPYVGSDSWMRTMPDEGTQVLLAQRGDLPEWEIARYYHQEVRTRLDNYKERINTYRPLKGGEFDMQSTGHAGVFGSKRGHLEFRAAGLYGGMDRDDLTIYWKAPVHNVRGPMHKLGSIGDEIRFGVVSRPSADKPKTIVNFVREGSWAKEYMRVLSSKNDPAVLVDYREGNVYNDDGTTADHIVTGNPNRIQAEYGHAGGTKTRWQLDNLGNMAAIFPVSAEEGIQIQHPGGSFVHRVGKTAKWFVGDHIVMTSGQNMQLAVGENAELGASGSFLVSGRTSLAIRGLGLVGGAHQSNVELGTNARFDTLGKMDIVATGSMALTAATFSVTTASPAYIRANPIYLGKTAATPGVGKGVARLQDKTAVTPATDPAFWVWAGQVTATLNTLVPGSVTPPLTTLIGQIIQASTNTFSD